MGPGVCHCPSLPDHLGVPVWVWDIRTSSSKHNLDMEKIADNGNKNNSKQLERPSSNRALSTALQSV